MRCGRSIWNCRRTLPRWRGARCWRMCATWGGLAKCFARFGRNWCFMRGAEACADGGGQSVGGAADQRLWHAGGGGCGARDGRAGDGADFDRQGGEPDEPDGREQAAGGNVLPGAGYSGVGRWRDAVHYGAVRQCAWQHRERGAFVPAAARTWRAADGDPSGYATILHDGARGGVACVAGERGGGFGYVVAGGGRDFCARYGPAGADFGSGAADDCAGGAAAGEGYRNSFHRSSAREKLFEELFHGSEPPCRRAIPGC